MFPTGNEIEFGNAIFHRIDSGLIAERWVQPDVFGLLTQIDAVEEPS
jgi:predicted ester cyclase